MTSNSKDESEEIEEEYSDSVNDPFESIRNIQSAIASLSSINVQDMVTPEVIRAISHPTYPGLQKAFTQPIIDPEVLAKLQQPAIGEDLLEELQEPTIDPETIQAMQQPLIDEETLKTLSEPVIDPDLFATTSI